MVKITSSAKINFDNKVQNLSQLAAYLENSDRNIRKVITKKLLSSIMKIWKN